MTVSAEENEIIKTILTYVESGDTDKQSDTMHHPVSGYSDPEQLRQETEILFRKFPIIVGHVEKLAEPGSYFTYDDTGVPILVTRNRDEVVKAFLNVCRHRGARLANEPCGKANTISCPYHKWTYDLDGNLRGLPQPQGFGEIDKKSLGLVELPAFERHGLIWVRPSASDTEIDIDAWLAPMEEQLEALDLATHTIYQQWSVPLAMNWHLAIEGFQECYHFCSAHEHTACSAYLNNQSVFLDHYPHVRHAVPLPKITELQQQDESAWDYRSNFMTQNYLFPSNYIQVMTDHVYVHSVIPTGIDTCLFSCMMLIPETPKTEKAKSYWAKNYDVIRTVFGEDFAIGENIQKGLATGANENFVFGRYEVGLHLAKNAIKDALDGKLSV